MKIRIEIDPQLSEPEVVVRCSKLDENIVHHKLYELEELLPRAFIRISKSAILNSSKVYSIARNLTASSRVEFFGSHKAVFVSRNYYKLLKDKISSGSKS